MRLAMGNSPGPNPLARPAAASSARTTATWSANAAVGDDPAPKKASQSPTPRRTAASADPPNHSRGYGFWNGLGSIEMPDSWANSPLNVTDGAVHSSFISAMPSVNRAMYRSWVSPNAANGRPGPPEP